MDRLWGKGYKQWLWEYKYCRGGKTLCTLYAKENSFGLQIIFGRDERTKAEAVLDTLSPKIREAYENAYTWHDGKWVMFLPENVSEFPDYLRLLALKRRPNRK